MTSVASLDSPDAPLRSETLADRVVRLFGEVRLDQSRQLDLALGISSKGKPLPLVIVSGPNGSGKSAILAEVLADEFSVTVNCAAATSGMAVLTAILRRLALARKVKQPIATPDESPDSSPRYTHRQAFKDAARKISRDAPAPQAVKNDAKFLEISSWAEVRSLTGFKQKFESLVDSEMNKLFLIIDNAHCLTEGRNFQVLNFLSCLRDFFALPVSVIFVTCRNLPPEVSCRACAVVQFPGYTQFQANKIITAQLRRTSAGASRPGAVLAFLPPFMLFYYPRSRDNFATLLKEACRLFSEAVVNRIFEKPGDEAKLAIKNFCASETPAAPIKSVIPRLGKILIVASFLAAHNPANFDAKIFSTTRAKSGRAGVSNFKKAKLDADPISVRPPKPFSLPRLFAIAEYLAAGALSQSLRTLQLIRSLTQQGLLKRCGGDWLDGNLKLACHAPLTLVHGFAGDLGIRLDEVLF